MSVAHFFGLSGIFASSGASTAMRSVEGIALWTALWVLLTLVRAVASQFRVQKSLSFTVWVFPLVVGCLFSTLSIVTDLNAIRQRNVLDNKVMAVLLLGLFSPFLIGLASTATLLTLHLLVGRMDPGRTTGMCLNCGYSLRGLPENRCPECGKRFDRGVQCPP